MLKPNTAFANQSKMAFAIGYYYGRTYPATLDLEIPDEDKALMANPEFIQGIEAGKRDFEDVDLVRAALSMSMVQ